MGRALDVVNRFYEATDAGRIDDLRALVSDDVTFTGPVMKTTGAGEYVAMNEQLLGFHAGTTILRQLEDGDDVCSIYELGMRTPGGETVTLTIADWIRVDDGKIAAQRIYFDPREFTAAFGS
jgi:ketosteroid isomerase-like protein